MAMQLRKEYRTMPHSRSPVKLNAAMPRTMSLIRWPSSARNRRSPEAGTLVDPGDGWVPGGP